MDTANIKKNEYLDSDSDNEVLSIYLREINRIPLISHEEEYELALRARKGDKAARERLLNAEPGKHFAEIRRFFFKLIRSNQKLVVIPRTKISFFLEDFAKHIQHENHTGCTKLSPKKLYLSIPQKSHVKGKVI